MSHLLHTPMLLGFQVGWGTTLAIKTVIVLALVPLAALILGYVFLLKMMSHMQSRLGPMDPGGFHGWFQLIGDGIKFMQKEDVFPSEADRRVFALAPVVVVMSTFLIFVVIPAGPRIAVARQGVAGAPFGMDVGVFYALAVSSLSVIGVLMAGWASANKYALLGALRAAAQLIAYELPLVLAVVGVVVQAGTMSLQGIVFWQQGGHLFGWGGLGFPLIFTQFVGFALFMVAAQAELTQPPFDMPVAESELVAGYMVEYTGFRFLFFFIGEFGTAFAFAALAATLFLGGWALPGVHGTMADVLGPFVLFAKIMFVAFLMFWARFTYPRFREDQLQALAWKWLIPIALGNILVTGILKVAF
jgi:NADH-quinone oxidoreductase subunit H